MSFRALSAGLLIAVGVGGLLLGVLRSPAAADDETTANLGKQIAKLDLKDTAGKSWTVADLKDSKAVVVLFLGTQCPINNAYLPRLVELHKTYAEKGVRFIAINANKQDTDAKIAEHVREYKISFPVLKDVDCAAADRFGARRTPEAFILDGDLKIRYQGRIDDQFGVGYQRAKATRDDLVMALDEVLAGKKVSVPATPVAGCVIARAKSVAAEGKITYAKEVSRIVQSRCQECHRPGQIGPMPLLTYDDVSSWAETIKEVVTEKRMPPWHADEVHHGQFANERALTKAEYDTLLKWIELGCPKGDDRDLPAPRQFADTWTIGKPDVVIDMGTDFDVPAKAPPRGVRYQYFAAKTSFDEDKWVQAAECKPGQRAVVHHIIAYVNKNKEASDPLGSGMLAAYAPGDLGSVYPPGAAKRLPKGATIQFQMHYTPNGVACKDRSSVALVFAKEPPKVEVKTRAISNFFFTIPPNDANFEVKSLWSLPKDAVIYSLLPHMHLRGKDFKYDVVYPDGKTVTILNVPRYDFGWQATYHLKQPLKLPAGTQIKCFAHFDNSKNNPWNPDPTAKVIFGEQTWEEMMIGFIDFAYVDAK
jgi:peroxiredoxin